MLEFARYTFCTEVGRYCNHRFVGLERAAFCSDDNNTIGSTDTIEGRGGLTFEHVDALDVLGVDIDGAVGDVGTCNR